MKNWKATNSFFVFLIIFFFLFMDADVFCMLLTSSSFCNFDRNARTCLSTSLFVWNILYLFYFPPLLFVKSGKNVWLNLILRISTHFLSPLFFFNNKKKPSHANEKKYRKSVTLKVSFYVFRRKLFFFFFISR